MIYFSNLQLSLIPTRPMEIRKILCHVWHTIKQNPLPEYVLKSPKNIVFSKYDHQITSHSKANMSWPNPSLSLSFSTLQSIFRCNRYLWTSDLEYSWRRGVMSATAAVVATTSNNNKNVPSSPDDLHGDRFIHLSAPPPPSLLSSIHQHQTNFHSKLHFSKFNPFWCLHFHSSVTLWLSLCNFMCFSLSFPPGNCELPNSNYSHYLP